MILFPKATGFIPLVLIDLAHNCVSPGGYVKSKLVITLCVFGTLYYLVSQPLAQVPARATADPAAPVFWTAAQMKELDARLAARQDPNTRNAGTQLIASANAIYRTGNSLSEIHEKQGEIIFIREGEGAIVVGGK